MPKDVPKLSIAQDDGAPPTAREHSALPTGFASRRYNRRAPSAQDERWRIAGVFKGARPSCCQTEYR